ncbi:MAG: helix-hairpin-helix domain-containing protein [Pyrinomonadaceae bacterium]
MNPRKVDRNKIIVLTDLPNIGKACALDLRVIGISDPMQLIGMCPLEMYNLLCKRTGARHDPCIIDVFLSITRFMAGDEPKPWWTYTKERKRLFIENDSEGQKFS